MRMARYVCKRRSGLPRTPIAKSITDWYNIAPMAEILDELAAIRLARAGEQGGFERIIELYQDRIFNLAYRSLGDTGAAEDLTQEVFLAAFEALARFDDRAKISTWLYRIAMNAIISHVRHTSAQKRGGTRRARSLDDENALEPSANRRVSGEREQLVDADMLRGEADREVQQALAELEPEQREVAILRDIEGLSYEDIAEITKVNVNTVRSRLHRAREALRQKLKHLIG